MVSLSVTDKILNSRRIFFLCIELRLAIIFMSPPRYPGDHSNINLEKKHC